MLAYVALGSNLGDRLAHLQTALDAIAHLGTLRAVSHAWETRPMYVEDQPPFLNAVAALDADDEPLPLLDALLHLEARMGRVRSAPKGPRTIDLDLLDAEGTRLDSPRLVLPHPGLPERDFVLYPLCEIAPAWVHPTHGLSARALRDALGPRDLRPVARLRLPSPS